MSATTDAPESTTTGRVVPGVSHLEWDTFAPYFAGAWQQGEHVTLLGHTGSGKTTMSVEILARRSFVTALGVKPKDDTLQRLIREQKWPRVKEWSRRPAIQQHTRSQRLVLWPDYRRPEDEQNLQWQLDRALREMFADGGWTIFADELFIICKQLRLGPLMEKFWTLGRSIDLTIVGGSQRPAFIPLLAYSQATHLFLWRDNDETNLKRLAGLGGVHSALVRRTVPALPKHVALYLNTRTGEMATTKAPAPGKKGRP